MRIAEQVADIFNILHDGTIVDWFRDKDILTLKISCQYLAKIINPTFNFFFIELVNTSTIKLEPWWDDSRLNELIVSPKNIFQGELEILSAKVIDKNVQIICNQRSKSLKYYGGNLIISCKKVEIYDEAKAQLSVVELNNICNSYWRDFLIS